MHPPVLTSLPIPKPPPSPFLPNGRFGCNTGFATVEASASLPTRPRDSLRRPSFTAWCFPEFVRISGKEYPWLVAAFRSMGILSANKPPIRFEKVRYGDHPSQVAQVMVSANSANREAATGKAPPLFVFLHGGAWGSGFPTMYRLLSLPFLERGFRSVILGYRTFPDATIEGQVDDLVLALEKFSQDGAPVVLMGHSSGAHVCLLAAATGRLPPSIKALIGASGVYDIEEQYQQETKLGVNELSPMSPTIGRENFRKYSPARLWKENQQLSEDCDFPPMLLVHGGSDEVVSPKSSQEFQRILGQDRCVLEIMDGVGHQEVVTDTCLGGKTQSVICDWIKSTIEL